MNSLNHLSIVLAARVGMVLAGIMSAASLPAQTSFFADTFDRPNNTDLNASTDGKSGTLGPLNWVQKGPGGGTEVLGNQLKAGDNGAGAGWAFAYIDRNFVDAGIASAGGFSVSIDMVAYATAGATRHMGIAVGMSKAEAEGWAHNNPASFTYVDLFVGYRGNLTAIQVFDNGVQVGNNTTAGGPATLPTTLVVDFSFSSFAADSTVSYKASFGGVEMDSGSFTWSESNQNYIGIYTNLTNRQARMDNFDIRVNLPAEPLVLKITPNGPAYDFEWNSQPGKIYDLLTSTDLATPIVNWPAYNDGVTLYENIPATGAATTLTAVPSSDPRRFFAMREQDAPPVPPLLTADFEETHGDFSASKTAGTDWEWGTPASTGAGGSVSTGNGSSTKCWGTNLGTPGYYADPTTDSCLISPVIDLTSVAGAELSFAHAIDINTPGSDTAVLRIVNADTTVVIDTIPFPDGTISSANWQTAGPITLPVGAPIRLEWCLNGTGGDSDDFMGWYIDDVLVVETP
jgi:hypothetical protein